MERIKKSQFKFSPSGYGHYLVTYYTARRGDYYSHTTDRMYLVDQVLGEPEPTQASMVRLRQHIVAEGCHFNKHGHPIYHY